MSADNIYVPNIKTFMSAENIYVADIKTLMSTETIYVPAIKIFMSPMEWTTTSVVATALSAPRVEGGAAYRDLLCHNFSGAKR